jgi:hypothetical protein
LVKNDNTNTEPVPGSSVLRLVGCRKARGEDTLQGKNTKRGKLLEKDRVERCKVGLQARDKRVGDAASAKVGKKKRTTLDKGQHGGFDHGRIRGGLFHDEKRL